MLNQPPWNPTLQRHANPSRSMAHTVFICHSARDKQVADAACAALEARRIPCWIAPRDILPSDEWGKAVVSAIHECRILVLIFSANADASPQVRREVERAVSKGKTILPFRIEDVMPSDAMEYALGNTHWLDALTPPMEANLAHLADTVVRILDRDVSAPPPFTAASPNRGPMHQTEPQVESPPQSESGRIRRKPWLAIAGGGIGVAALAGLLAWHPWSGHYSGASAPGAHTTIPAPSATGQLPGDTAGATQGAGTAAVPGGPDATGPQPAHAIATTAAGSANNAYQRGSTLYYAGNYVAALAPLKEACDGGNADGCNILGYIYGNGMGVPEDDPRAVAFFRKACDGGGVLGCRSLGDMYEHGEGVPVDKTQAAAFYRKACKGQVPEACYDLKNLQQ